MQIMLMKFRQLLSNIDASNSYEVLEETGDLKQTKVLSAVLLKIAIIAIVNFADQAGFALQNVNFDDFAQAMTSHKTFRLK